MTQCVVPNVVHKTLSAALIAIGRGNCDVGVVTRKYSSSVAKRKVMAEKPKAGTHLPEGSTVDLTVSRGKKPKRKHPKHRPH